VVLRGLGGEAAEGLLDQPSGERADRPSGFVGRRQEDVAPVERGSPILVSERLIMVH
jgi:hypothetical protein